MNKSRIEKHIQPLLTDQADYLKEYHALEDYINARLDETYELNKLDKLYQRVRKEQRKFKKMHEDIVATQHFLNQISDKKSTLQEFPAIKDFNDKFKEVMPDCKRLFAQLDAKKQDIKAMPECYEAFQRLARLHESNVLNIKEFDAFLTNPTLEKNKKVIDLNNEIIKRYAWTITNIDRDLFLQLQLPELFSPSNYSSSTIKACTTHNLNVTAYVSSLILHTESIKERTIIMNRWILVADYLLRELNNRSGCESVLAAFSRAEIMRLKKTWQGLPKETQRVYDNLCNTIFPSNPSALSVLELKQPAIPSMALLRRDINFLIDGNPTVSAEKDSYARQMEMMTRTSGGKRIVVAIEKLKKELSNKPVSKDIDLQLNWLLRQMLIAENGYNEDIAYEISKEVEPLRNNLQPTKLINLSRTVKPSKSVNDHKPSMRHTILEELIRDLSHAPLQGAFQMDANYVIDWSKEEQINVRELRRELDANIETVESFLVKEKSGSLRKQAHALIGKLRKLDVEKTIKEVKMQNLEQFLCTRLCKLKIEFGIAARQGVDASSQRINAIETELNNINKLQENCPLSVSLTQNLAVLNAEVANYKQLINKPKEVEDNKVANWKTRSASFSQPARCPSSLLYAHALVKLNNEIDVAIPAASA